MPGKYFDRSINMINCEPGSVIVNFTADTTMVQKKFYSIKNKIFFKRQNYFFNIFILQFIQENGGGEAIASALATGAEKNEFAGMIVDKDSIEKIMTPTGWFSFLRSSCNMNITF